jgi:hypothetical protein
LSLAIGHFAAGASTAFLVLNLLPQRIRDKVPDHGFIGITAGLLAMVPDLARFFPALTGFHNSNFAAIFFFHRIMDRLDTRDSVWVSVGILGVMLVLMLILWVNSYWRGRAK